MSWTIIVVIVCLLLTAFMLWQEFSRGNRLRLPFRIAASVLAVVALACIALPISYQSKSSTGVKDGVLLTNGINKDSLSTYQNSKLFTTETAIVKANPKHKITLIDLADIPQGKLDIANLHILGDGLSGNELKQLGNYPIQFHPTQIPVGIQTINWPHQIKAGERLTIQGKFSGTSDKVKLVLKGLNTGLDSIAIEGNSDFQLQTTPKNTGKATYTLLAIDGKDTLEHETIAFEIEPAKPLKVLLLSTSPGFETRFLKNWLAQHGYGVVVRTAISKEKFSREYFNMPQTGVDMINPALLDKFDVIIGDLSSFKLLSSAENSALQQQMLQKGLGVIVKADSTGKGTSFLANAFATDRLADKNLKPLSLNINGQSTPSAKLNLDAVFIKPQANTQPLVTDEQGHIIVNSSIYGGGKIVFSTLSTTFNWALSGNQSHYTALWSMLIEKASRKATVGQTWSVAPALPLVDERATLTLNGPIALPQQIKIEGSKVMFAQNPTLPFSWTATYWPDNYGWQQVAQSGAPVYWWYAYNTGDWLTLNATEKVLQTKLYAKQHHVKAGNSVSRDTSISVPVSKIYFYLLLLLCCTYLWVEPKL